MKIITTDVIYLGKATPGSGGGGGGAVIDALNVTPSTSAQTITASGGTDGYSPVNVAAVTSAIDANIVAGNIKKDVSILGVTGSYKGTTPTGTIQITTNGTHDVTNYANADVQVPTTAPAEPYLEWSVSGGKLVSTTNRIINLTGVTDFSASGGCLYNAYYNNTNITGTVNLSSLTGISHLAYACAQAFTGCTGITSVDLSSLQSIIADNGCTGMFSGCTGITSVDLSSLQYVAVQQKCCQNMFSGCTGLTSMNLPALTTVSASYGCDSMFSGCTGLTSMDLSALATVSGNYACQYMFRGCIGLTSVDLSALTTINGLSACSAMCSGCTNLTSLSFPSITPNSFGTRTNQFNSMCNNVSNITLHFPSNTQAKVETLAGYSTTAPFGAVAGTVLFDLPATYTLTGADSNTYSRNPKYDTATSLAWKVGAYGTTNFTPAYYTSGTTDPSVSDAIYSDAACTTSVTTVSAIA